MYSKAYEFSAVHEAGHTVCAACFRPPSQEEIAKEYPHLPSSHPIAVLPFPHLSSEDILIRPSRIREINIWFDNENKRHDGEVCYNPAGLLNEQRLVITLGGKVAELMARTEGHWYVTEIQTRFSNHEFDNINIRDMQTAYERLRIINESSHTKRSLTEFVSTSFAFLEKVWDLVVQIADAVISKYDTNLCKATLSYGELSSEIQAQLHQLESTPHLKDI